MRVLPVSLYLGVALVVAHSPSPAEAAWMPAELQNRETLEVADSGERAKVAPRALSPKWGALGDEPAGTWRAMWNPYTGVPQRIFGRGTAAPGAVRSAERAEAHARNALREHLEILAPGSSAADFELVANHLDDTGLRTVAFAQSANGMRVIGGQVNFRFRNDRLFMMGSEALPHVSAPPAIASISSRVARERARKWVETDFGPQSTPPSTASGPSILPIVRGPHDIEYRTVKSVQVDAPAIPASWEVYVDAASGEPVARRQTLAFASGTILFDVPIRRPGAERDNLPASFLSIAVDGVSAVTNFFGQFAGPSGSSTVSFGLQGPLVAVENSGNNAVGERIFADGAVEIFGNRDSEIIDSQLALFVHTNRVKEYVRQYTDNPWLDDQLQVVANLDDSCNAFYNPQADSINFFTEGDGCNNTGRLVDVIYHEFGHAIHANAIIQGVGAFDGATSEGVGDYLAATINADPGMGRGFFLDNPGAPLRHIDPEAIGQPRPVFPDDFEGRQDTVHADGQIIAVTLWKLREGLIEEYGVEEGVARADEIWYGILQRTSNMTTAFAEALAVDDDDGDLSNGTPNECLITRVFLEGGLADVSFGLEPPTVDGYDLALSATADDGCDLASIDTVEVNWLRRDDPVTSGSELFESVDGGYAGQLPEQPDQTVLKYQVQVAFADGATAVFPNNPADDQYELFVGGTEDIYATTFDNDPFTEGWTSGAEVGDDAWAWGQPGSAGLGGGPTAAYAGSGVLSTGLDEDSGGVYPNNTLTWVESPAIDISGLDDARLQFRRWLAVEDGFFDQARIFVNGEVVWENADSNQGNASDVHHLDKEWRFQDIDLTGFIDDGTVQVRFEIESDQGLAFAGWAIDDFRIVTYQPEFEPDPECPDFEAGQVCDGECPPGCEPPDDDDDDGDGPGAGGDDISNSGCGCSAGQARLPDPGTLILGLLLLASLAVLRRRSGSTCRV